MKIFITGASGYIGGTVALRLKAAGHSIRGLCRDLAKADRLKQLEIEPVLGSLEDVKLLTDEAQAADVVINAASSDHRPCVEALVAALKESGKALIHTSGSSVIGDDAKGNTGSERVFDDDGELLVAPLKRERREIDLLVLQGQSLGIRAMVICPSLIYGHGSGLNPHSIQIPTLVRRAKEFGAVRVIGKGLNHWSNVHIDDLADLYLLAVERGRAGSFYFAENGENSFAELGAALAARLKLGAVQSLDADTAAESWGAASAYFTFGSNSRVRGKRARAELGWQPHRPNVLRWIETDLA
jgi:nucleoside-diphosphate-sugar epimerase